jgi:hypothetical protein
MTDYTKLVKALRGRAQRENEWYEHGGDIINDAADAIEELMKNLNMASQELSWTISYTMHLMRDIDELHDMVNEVYYDEL